MKTHRRSFLHGSVAAGAWLFLRRGARAGLLRQDAVQPAAKQLKILILGGTGFLGPWQVERLRERGHEITLFNRGKTRPDLFPDLEHLAGDRDPDKGDGLKALEGRSFDAVLDNSGYYPRHVKAAAELLAPHVKTYLYVSSISAYKSTAEIGMDEDAALATMEDPTLEQMGQNFEYYGALKALCEQAALQAMPGRAAVIRPGYIVGPGDSSHRFTYWPVRIEMGGEVAVPGAPTDPIQVIDARDLADWMVLMAEQGTGGVFNACGPDGELSMRDVVETCRDTVSGDATFTWLDLEFLKGHPEAQFPIWSPFEGESKGIHTVSNARAVAAGLTFRPLAETVRDLLDWFKNDVDELVRKRLLDRLANDNEKKLLEQYHAQHHAREKAPGGGR